MKIKFFNLFQGKKSQAAIEFLSTYAWAFVVITVTMAALYSFGFFDFGKYLPQTCTFPDQFKCEDFSMNSGTIKLKLLNNIGEDVQVISFEVTNDATPPITCTGMPAGFIWPKGTEQDIQFTSCSGGAYISGSRTELKISMTYYAVNTPSRPNHIVRGKLNGRVG